MSKSNGSTKRRGRDLTEALAGLALAKNKLWDIDLRTCRGDLRDQIKEAREAADHASTLVGDAIAAHLESTRSTA